MSTIIAITTVGEWSVMILMIIICIQSITVISEVYMVVDMSRIVALLYLSISIVHAIVVLRCAADIVLIHMI